MDDNLARYPFNASQTADGALDSATDETKKALSMAVSALNSATAVFVFTGAGMSVDSGIPDYRGPCEQAQWGGDPELSKLYGKSTQQLSENALWFQEDPAAAWGCDVRRWLSRVLPATPHQGYHVLNSLCARQRDGWFIATSNIDHQHIFSGADPDRVYAMHGEVFANASKTEVRYQCSFDGTDGVGDCPGGLWTANTAKLLEGLDEATGRVREESLPCCQLCHRPGRPNYLAFKDEFCRVSAFAFGPRRQAMVSWLRSLRSSGSDAALVILEIGCGTVVRNPRNRTEHELRNNHNAVLVRINLHEGDVSPDDPRQISIRLRAEEALLALDAMLKVDPGPECQSQRQ